MLDKPIKTADSRYYYTLTEGYKLRRIKGLFSLLSQVVKSGDWLIREYQANKSWIVFIWRDHAMILSHRDGPDFIVRPVPLGYSPPYRLLTARSTYACSNKQSRSPSTS